MSIFTVSVTERPVTRLFGVSVRTDMTNAPMDCSDLWENIFGPRMHEISGEKSDEYHGPSYGISVMLDSQYFEYWAAMEAPEGMALPTGMKQFEIPASLYASCLVPSIANMGEAYTYMYEWPRTQEKYILNMQAPCFEYYDNRFGESGVFELFLPVVKR